MIRRPPRSTLSSSSAASDVYKRQLLSLTGLSQMVLVLGAENDPNCHAQTGPTGIVVTDIWASECSGNLLAWAGGIRLFMGMYYIVVNTCGKCFSDILTVERRSMKQMINNQMIRPDSNTMYEAAQAKTLKLSISTAVIYGIMLLGSAGLWIVIGTRTAWKDAPGFSEYGDPAWFQYTCLACAVSRVEVMSGWVFVLWAVSAPIMYWVSTRGRNVQQVKMKQERYAGKLGAVAAAKFRYSEAKKSGDHHQANMAQEEWMNEANRISEYSGPEKPELRTECCSFVHAIASALAARAQMNTSASSMGASPEFFEIDCNQGAPAEEILNGWWEEIQAFDRGGRGNSLMPSRSL
eukprot:TRINITY_DN20052_c0_g1_i3.p1 TRINITY_DN20052_c0_g1~~TRINITY_DN20052_c0_g1_i3.p1  ORF type:complete len:350 (+),score=73.49 TRINITY_DN20052_c0_g1_i3:96-1145(+)